MSLFRYPKAKHARKFVPPVYKRYQTYKRWLQVEFSRVCVYCRQPDSSAPNLNFGADHYRPKGNTRFAHLVCDYDNLYYCCGSCNSRKSDDWPADESAGPFVVNPCDHEMASHLRFDATTGEIRATSDYGRHTEALLQLNDPESVEYRKSTMLMVGLLTAEIARLADEQKECEADLRDGVLSQTEFDAEVATIQAARGSFETSLLRLTGGAPLALSRKRSA